MPALHSARSQTRPLSTDTARSRALSWPIHWATGQSPVYPSGRPNPVHCSSDPFVWRFWPTDADPRDHCSGKNYSDVAEDDGVDDGNGPAPVGAAGQDDSESDSSSGLSLSSDDEAGGHSGTLCAPRPPTGTRPLSPPMASCAAACAAVDLSDDRRPPSASERRSTLRAK
jgi:hypothetical protein